MGFYAGQPAITPNKLLVLLLFSTSDIMCFGCNRLFDLFKVVGYIWISCPNLSFDGVLKTPSFDGGGGKSICENNRKSNKIMQCVDFF